MKVHVDTHRCKGTALCVAVAPEVFTVNAAGIAEALMPEVSGELAAEAEEAALVCPASALEITADDA